MCIRDRFYRNAIAVKESVTSALRDKNYHNLADHPNVTVYTGVGSFVSADVVSVRTSTEEIWLTSKQIEGVSKRNLMKGQLLI